MKQNYDCCACKCSFLQTYFSVLCWSVPPCKCNIAMVDLSLMPANQLRRHLGVRFFSTLYYVWPGFGVFGRKNIGYELICCSFFCHDALNFVFFFNAILNCLNTLQDIKKPKGFGSLLPETPTRICPIPHTSALQLLFTYLHKNSIFLHKTDIS